jgi:hypothetical protein
MRCRVLRVAVLPSELHRNVTVGSDSENEQELLEIPSVVLGVAVGDRRGSLASQQATGSFSILPTEPHRGGIVVELLEGERKNLAGSDNRRSQERTPIGAKEPVESTPQSVIADLLGLTLGEPEGSRSIGMNGFRLAIDRFALNDDGPKESSETLGVGDLGSGIKGRDETIENGLKAQAIEKVIQEGKSAESPRGKGNMVKVLEGVGLHAVAQRVPARQRKSNTN